MQRKELELKLEAFCKGSAGMRHSRDPISPERHQTLYALGLIPLKDLQTDKYYFGTCRNARVAKWNGKVFTYIRSKFGERFPETINHPENDDGYDLFFPVGECEPQETETIRL